MTEVTQAAREAAASAAQWQIDTGWEPSFFVREFPAAVRHGAWDDHDLVQAFARFEAQARTAEKDRLLKLGNAMAEALEYVRIGGNHLALLIGPDHPPFDASTEEALEHYGYSDVYEIWCAWRAIMRTREPSVAWSGEQLR